MAGYDRTASIFMLLLLCAASARASDLLQGDGAETSGDEDAVPLGSNIIKLQAVPVSQSVGRLGRSSGGGAQVQGVNAAKFNIPSADLLVADQEFLATFAQNTPAAEVERVASLIKESGAEVKYTAHSNSDAWQGVSFKFTDKEDAARSALLQRLADTAEVTSIEPNFVLQVSPVAEAVVPVDAEAAASVAAVQSRLPSWGLDRIDGSMDGQYTYGSDGEGVCVYVVDSGVKKGHADFGSRRLTGAYIRYADDAWGQTDDDRNKHGTHVAGTIAGSLYGVAKGAYIVPVRVLDSNGAGSTESLVTGLNWVVSDSRTQCRKKVVNLSLGLTGRVASVDSAVAAAAQAGVLVVVAAGNEGQDACNCSPANSPSALTVGATDVPTNAARRGRMNDPKATFSNYGSCVDIFAPGVDIISDSLDGRSGLKLSGTSMAAPHVAGLAARLWGSGACSSGKSCASELVSRAQQNTVTNGRSGSPRRVAVLGSRV